MAPTQFPSYVYAGGAASVAPRDCKNPRAEADARDAIVLAYTIAEHMQLQPQYGPAFATADNLAARQVDAVLARKINAANEPQLFAIARHKVATALAAGSWKAFMAGEGAYRRERRFRSDSRAPDLMSLAMASTLAKRMADADAAQVAVVPPPRPAAVPPARQEAEQGSLFDWGALAAT